MRLAVVVCALLALAFGFRILGSVYLPGYFLYLGSLTMWLAYLGVGLAALCVILVRKRIGWGGRPSPWGLLLLIPSLLLAFMCIRGPLFAVMQISLALVILSLVWVLWGGRAFLWLSFAGVCVACGSATMTAMCLYNLQNAVVAMPIAITVVCAVAVGLTPPFAERERERISTAGKFLVFGALALTVVAMALPSLLPAPRVMPPLTSPLRSIEGYDETRLEGTAHEFASLGDGVDISRRVYLRGWEEYVVSVILSSENRKSIHQPEVCMPFQGYVIDRTDHWQVGGRPWKVISAHHELNGEVVQAYTFYNQAGKLADSRGARSLRDIFDRAFHNRIDRWGMVTVFTQRTNEANLPAFLEKLTASWRIDGRP